MNNTKLQLILITVLLALGAGYWLIQTDSSSTGNIEPSITSPAGIDEATHSPQIENPNDKPKLVDSKTPNISAPTIDAVLKTTMLLSEPELGTPEYLNARDQAVERLPDQLKTTRHRVVRVNFDTIKDVLTTVIDSSNSSVGPYEISLFDDVPCTFSTAKASELNPGFWSIESMCNERDDLRINVWPEISKFALIVRTARNHYQMAQVTDNYAVVYEVALSAFPQNND